MPEQRIRYAPLRDKITSAAEAASHIKDGTSLFISGFTAGYPKLIPAELVKRAEAGEQMKINIYAGASTGDAVDGVLARAGLVKWRRPYMSDRGMRTAINREEILFKDDHLSGLSSAVRAGAWGPVDVAVVEVAAVTEKGQLIPTLSVGNTPSYVKMANKVILEVADADPPELEGIHDIYIPEDPPWRMPIPIYRAGDRVGKPFIELDPEKVVAVVYSQEPDASAYFSDPDEVSLLIAEQLLDFVRHETKKGRIPENLPWQSGVGDVANAVLAGFKEDHFFKDLSIYSEVLQDTVLDLIDMDKVRASSGSALTLSLQARERFFKDLERYKEKIVLRPVEISNSPEVIARLGVLAVNTALEIDIYGQVNSTHVMGSQMMNGIGGSGDFERNGAISFMVTPSIAKGGAISCIVPMVSHVDHSEHSVDVIITEQGLVDTRNLTPRQVAEAVITKCAHPMYRDQLMDYYQRALHETGGHEPHLLAEALSFHQRFMQTGDMRPVSDRIRSVGGGCE
ncbi:MAG: succinate CoA transferase [Proteobacteria bacterium]|nr:succinate CoA transferase [Pseudomonadota bacterium]MBU4382452.1 succinate CoA transferase [Pseudomonadota bacterium]MCG2764020.1 succinate CoA transferase [Desulfarculaceae bacterium]